VKIWCAKLGFDKETPVVFCGWVAWGGGKQGEVGGGGHTLRTPLAGWASALVLGTKLLFAITIMALSKHCNFKNFSIVQH
jgi:hypothetical protein